MDFTYALTPFLAWFLAGGIKFAINSIKARKLAFDQMGYGGLPSTHSAVVTSMAALIALREGIDNAMFGLAVTLAFIVILDATGLRAKVGKQAAAINQLSEERKDVVPKQREKMGHSWVEILAGTGVGVFTAWMIAG